MPMLSTFDNVPQIIMLLHLTVLGTFSGTAEAQRSRVQQLR